MHSKETDLFTEDLLEEDLLNEDDEEEIIYVSKSEIKRDAEALKKVGMSLVELTANELAKLNLDEDLLYHVQLAQKIKKQGYRRQIQYIGKLLRSREIEPIQQALDQLNNRYNQQKVALGQLEKLRDNLIQSGDAEPILQLYPHADRQQLRHLARSAKKEIAKKAPEDKSLPRSAKQIFMYLKSL